ncbi:MAG: hypothetical protein DIU71_04190 [Proteobacteria bacterium]|nr:MAG: hypothetical protein DIU71_04190 [Pseudomonadota bacterium]
MIGKTADDLMLELPEHPLDLRALEELRDSLAHDPGALAAVYRKFLETAAQTIHSLHMQDDAARISSLHSLKGTAAMLGARRLAALAARLQHRLTREWIWAPQVMEKLLDELASLRSAIAAHIDRDARAP